ncbi:hypothetical protein NpNSSI1_00002402 [Neofusicoccum parvum]|nr:hypothetical protein NpNSSI1_00002402 [Neofusicoccum parvum]
MSQDRTHGTPFVSEGYSLSTTCARLTISPLRINTDTTALPPIHPWPTTPPPPPSGLHPFPRHPVSTAPRRPQSDILPAHIITTATSASPTTPSPLRRIAPQPRLRARPRSDGIALSRRTRLGQPLPPTPWEMSVSLMDERRRRQPAGTTVPRRPLGLVEARPAAAGARWSVPFGPDDAFADGGWVAAGEVAARTSGEEEERRRTRLWEVGPRAFGVEVEAGREGRPAWRRVMGRFSA